MKRRKSKLVSLLAFGVLLVMGLGLMSADDGYTVEEKTKHYYHNKLDSLHKHIAQWRSVVGQIDQNRDQQFYSEAKKWYKQIEFIVCYYAPSTANKMNGANLPEAEMSTPKEQTSASGFQVLEEVVFTDEDYNAFAVQEQLDNLMFSINKLRGNEQELILTPAAILDAIKLNWYRLNIHGISGFDSPVSFQSLEEAVYSLQASYDVLQYFQADAVAFKNIQALDYVRKHKEDFNSFNRGVFIAQYMNPLCIELNNFQKKSHIAFLNEPPRAIRPDARHLFDKDAIDMHFYQPAYVEDVNDEVIALGQQLFFDRRLSVRGDRSCADCHRPDMAFTDGIPLNESLVQGKKLMRNTPTLINSALQPVQFYDSRVPYLEDQVHAVISSEEEMGSSLYTLINSLQESKQYKKKVKAAFGEGTWDEQKLKVALAAYVRTLVAMDSPFDRYMNGDENALTEDQVQGFNLFMGKAKCGTCHFMPTFSGAVPPYFSKMESEVLGIPVSTAIGAAVDGDVGKYGITGMEHQRHQFKTTGLRNVGLTAPYMHNGVFATLEEVLDFYNEGGGAGRGINLDNQTLPTDPLELTEKEKSQIISFMQSLTDTVVKKNL